jgi:hypothetical protein
MKRWMVITLVVVLAVALAVPGVGLARGHQAPRGRGHQSRIWWKPIQVSAPTARHMIATAGTPFTVRGFVRSSCDATLSSDATVTILVFPKGSKVASDSLATVATLSTSAKSHNKTNYSAVLTIPVKGVYYLRAQLTYLDSSNVKHTLLSPRNASRIRVK